jgi:hypothetical protein
VDLGQFGSVDVTFDATKTRLVSGRHCKRGHLEKRIGWFTGTIRFEGEHDYTSVDTQRARGRVLVPHHLHDCRFGGGVRHFTLLHAHAHRDDTDLFVMKTKKGRLDFFASASNDVGPVFILRGAGAIGGRSSFSFDSGLDSAMATPPAPFTGTARFDAPSSWKGSLAVSFPGAPDVPTGGPWVQGKA